MSRMLQLLGLIAALAFLWFANPAHAQSAACDAFNAAVKLAPVGAILSPPPEAVGCNVSVSKKTDLTFKGEYRSLNLAGVSRVTLDALKVTFTPDAATTSATSAIRVYQSSDVTINAPVIIGGVSVWGVSPDQDPSLPRPGDAILGWPIGRGVTVDFSKNVVITKPVISKFQRGIVYGSSDGLTVEGGDIGFTRGAMITGGGSHNLLIKGNWLHDPTPWKPGGTGDHLDAFHTWTLPGQTVPGNNIRVIGNFVDQGAAYPFPTFLFEDNSTARVGFTNVEVAYNLVLNGHANGVLGGNMLGKIVNNEFRQAGCWRLLTTGGCDPRDAPAFQLKYGGVGVTPAAPKAVVPGLTVQGNIAADPGKLFALYSDNKAIPGGVATADQLAILRKQGLALAGITGPSELDLAKAEIERLKVELAAAKVEADTARVSAAAEASRADAASALAAALQARVDAAKAALTN